MNNSKKYAELAKGADDDPEIAVLNSFLDRLERIGSDVQELTRAIDLMRLEKENALRRRKSSRRA